MSDTKITGLTGYTPPITTDVLPIVDVTTSTTKKITIANLTAYIAALSEALTNKTSINKVAITAPATSATLTIADGKTLTANASIVLAGTDAKTLTLTNGLTVTTNDGTLAFGAASKTLTVNKSIALDGTDSTTMTFPGSSDTVVTLTATQTLTNKRITKRVLALSAGSATPTINTDTYDVVRITAQNAAITSFTTNLSGTPVDGDTLRISITDDGTARALTWGTSFESSGNVALPLTTVISTRLDVGFFWNTATSKWRCVATA